MCQQSNMSFTKKKKKKVEKSFTGMNIHFKTPENFLNNLYTEMIHRFLPTYESCSGLFFEVWQTRQMFL